jgi:pimeloyl-ACP methyl ester carboxylesterase
MPELQPVSVDTDRIRTSCWVGGPEDGTRLLFVHGNLVSGRWFADVAGRLSDDVRVVAPDLRGFGGTDPRPVDATRGLRDWSDDVAALVRTLGWGGDGSVHIVGWSLGGGIVEQYAIDHADDLASVTLLAPVAPYGYGGTRGDDGRPVHDDFAGSGGGAVNPDFSRRIAARDTSEEEPASSPRVVMRTFFYDAANAPDADEDVLLEEFLKTVCGDDNYPGTVLPSDNWPGMAPGDRGGQNAMSPKYCDTSGFADIDPKPPVLWVWGSKDPVVSDASALDFAVLGQAGVVPGWPGDEVFPAQPQVSQTRALLERYAAHGGSYREVCLEGVGHGAVVERPDEVGRLLTEVLAARGTGA